MINNDYLVMTKSFYVRNDIIAARRLCIHRNRKQILICWKTCKQHNSANQRANFVYNHMRFSHKIPQLLLSDTFRVKFGIEVEDLTSYICWFCILLFPQQNNAKYNI